MVVRQAHPGPAVPPYRSFSEKYADAEAYQRSEQIPWPVLVDDLSGTVHREYGTLADPAYLLDLDGRVAFYNVITSAPVLHQAMGTLLGQNGRGIVGSGWDRRIHMAPTIAAGWPALRRGLPQSFNELMVAMPGGPAAVWLGYQLRPLLAPLALRARPLPIAVKAALAAGAAVTAAAGIRRAMGRSRS